MGATQLAALLARSFRYGRAVSWETTEDWPDGRTEGGAFRAAAEVIVARRDTVTFRDRLRTWWHSTPDLPFAAMPLRVVLTPGWIYVETRKGGRQRARVESILGSRREAGRVIYAVADGDDLVVADRGGDALERALDETIGTTGEWRSPAAIAAVFCFALVGLAVALGTTLTYHDEAMDRIERGLTTSEAALGLYAGLVGVLLVFLFIVFFPQRYVADSLGLTSVRGLFGWVRSTIAVERVEGVIADRIVVRGKSGGSFTHFYVDVQLSDPRKTKRVHAPSGATGGRVEQKREHARQIARRLARLYDVELRDRLD